MPEFNITTTAETKSTCEQRDNCRNEFDVQLHKRFNTNVKVNHLRGSHTYIIKHYNEMQISF